eukprot:1448222-Pyramimonas_sp.AAC.1
MNSVASCRVTERCARCKAAHFACLDNALRIGSYLVKRLERGPGIAISEVCVFGSDCSASLKMFSAPALS